MCVCVCVCVCVRERERETTATPSLMSASRKTELREYLAIVGVSFNQLEPSATLGIYTTLLQVSSNSGPA